MNPDFSLFAQIMDYCWIISALRCDSYHLRGSKQQLQYGHQRGQFHQSTARISRSLQIHLDQQVYSLLPDWLWLTSCSLVGCSLISHS